MRQTRIITPCFCTLRPFKEIVILRYNPVGAPTFDRCSLARDRSLLVDPD